MVGFRLSGAREAYRRFQTPQIVLSDDDVEDTPLESISLAQTDPDLSDGATVATTLNGEYKNVTGFAEVVDYISKFSLTLFLVPNDV